MLEGLQRFALTDGLSVSIGSLTFERPWFPSTNERAQLIREVLPPWAIASGTTAGWVWTGIGHPDPWRVLREATPALSPLVRTTWKARIRNPQRHGVCQVSGLTVLDPDSTALDIAYCDASVDVCATQILLLGSPMDAFSPRHAPTRVSDARKSRAALVARRVTELRELYPDITR